MEGATGNLGASGRMVVGEAEVLFTPSPRWKSRACLSFPTQRWRGNRSRVRHEQGVKGAGNALCWAGWGQRVVWGWFGCHPQQSPKYTGSPDSSPPTEPGQGPGGAGRAKRLPELEGNPRRLGWGAKVLGGGGCAFGFGVLCMCTRVDACSCWLDQGVHACVCACVHACMCVCACVCSCRAGACVLPPCCSPRAIVHIYARTHVSWRSTRAAGALLWACAHVCLAERACVHTCVPSPGYVCPHVCVSVCV